MYLQGVSLSHRGRAHSLPLLTALFLLLTVSVAVAAASEPSYRLISVPVSSGGADPLWSSVCATTSQKMASPKPTTVKRKADTPHHSNPDFVKRLKQVEHRYPDPMIGNQLIAEDKKYRFIRQVIIGAHEYCFQPKMLLSGLPCLHLDDPTFHSEKVTFEMPGASLKPGAFRAATLPIDFAKRAAAIVEAVGNLCHITEPTFIYASREAQEASGDSDDDAPRDDSVPSPFTREESIRIELVLQECWMRCTHAQDKNFQNAVGKFFLESFFKLCTSVLDCHLEVLVSTNPNGQHQPGFTEVGWTLPAKHTRENSAPKTEWNKRVADAVIYDTRAKMYTVVAEVKSAKTSVEGSGLEQNAEQMLGLFAEGQTLMLGMVVHNLVLKPMVLRVSAGGLTLTEMLPVSLQPDDTAQSLALLMRMLIGFTIICGP